jgi:hypothetical protein
MQVKVVNAQKIEKRQGSYTGNMAKRAHGGIIFCSWYTRFPQKGLMLVDEDLLQKVLCYMDMSGRGCRMLCSTVTG